jgi:hypothetical protein
MQSPTVVGARGRGLTRLADAPSPSQPTLPMRAPVSGQPPSHCLRARHVNQSVSCQGLLLPGRTPAASQRPSHLPPACSPASSPLAYTGPSRRTPAGTAHSAPPAACKRTPGCLPAPMRPWPRSSRENDAQSCRISSRFARSAMRPRGIKVCHVPARLCGPGPRCCVHWPRPDAHLPPRPGACVALRRRAHRAAACVHRSDALAVTLS